MLTSEILQKQSLPTSAAAFLAISTPSPRLYSLALHLTLQKLRIHILCSQPTLVHCFSNGDNFANTLQEH